MEQTESQQIRLFIDMDGVLAKFNPIASEEELYEQGYFINLDPMPEVVNGIRQHIAETPGAEVYVLSAYLSDSDYALEEKQRWLDEYLPEIDQEHRIFCPCGEPKTQYIAHGIGRTDILIDDYTKNLLEWKKAGGKGMKLLNGINHTRGTWQGEFLHAETFGTDFRQKMNELKIQKTELQLTPQPPKKGRTR